MEEKEKKKDVGGGGWNGAKMREADAVLAALRAFHDEHYSVFPRDELTEKLCHAYYGEFVGEKPAGNAAKMREALERILQSFAADHYGLEGGLSTGELFALAKAALAAPPRNCDVGTAEEQIHEFYNFCRVLSKGVSCHGCQFFDKNYDDNHCAILWGQLPYEAPAAQEGGGQ